MPVESGPLGGDPTNNVTQGLAVADNFIQSIEAYIQNQILNTFIDKIPGVDIIGRTIEASLAQAEGIISVASSAITTQIEPLLTSAIPDAIAVVTNLAKTLNDNISALIGNIATTEDVLGTAITTLKGHAPELASWIYSNLAGSFGNVALAVLKEMEGQEADGINALLDTILKLPNPPDWFVSLTQGFRNRGAEWQALALPALLVGAIVGITEAIQEPFQVEARQIEYDTHPTKVSEPAILIDLLNKGLIDSHLAYQEARKSGYDIDPVSRMVAATQERLDPRDTAQMFFRNIINQSQALEEMHRHGLTPEYAQWMLTLSERLLPEDMVKSAFLRGWISDIEHDQTLAQYGYTPDNLALMRSLYFYIPGPQDLIHMGIRNVFNPEIVSKFDLIGDLPQAFVDAAAQQGISKDWAIKYWESHWIMPSKQEAFQMFQRTTDVALDPDADSITLSDGTTVHNIIGRSTLDLLLRDLDTPPYYRDKITEIAYRPITRIDIRRLNQVGLLDHAGVERAYLDLGYRQDHARQLADFTDALNKKAKKDEVTALADSLRKQILRLYTADKLSQDAAKTALSEIGASDAEIAVYLAESDIVKSSELATIQEAGIGKLYVAGIIDDKTAIQQLQTAGVPVDAQTALFAKWDLEIAYKGGTPHILAHRELTKGEALTALVDGLIDQPTAETMLEDLGYDKTGADAEISLTLYKAARATKAAQVEAVKSSYVNGVIEELDASSRLDALLVPADQRDGYLQTWTLQRETRTERIPIATLRDMVKGNYLTTADAFTHLKRHRFTDADATLLLNYWQNQPAPKGLVSVSGA